VTSHNFDLLSSFEAAGASTLGVTIMRTHMTFSYHSTQATGLADWNVGLLVGRDSDVTTPAGTNPVVETELDWMLLTAEFSKWNGGTENTFTQGSYDVRSKRKMEEMQQRYMLCLYNTGAAGAQWTYFARTLVALP
jgi:hypothetical protein